MHFYALAAYILIVKNLHPWKGFKMRIFVNNRENPNRNSPNMDIMHPSKVASSIKFTKKYTYKYDV